MDSLKTKFQVHIWTSLSRQASALIIMQRIYITSYIIFSIRILKYDQVCLSGLCEFLSLAYWYAVTLK